MAIDAHEFSKFDDVICTLAVESMISTWSALGGRAPAHTLPLAGRRLTLMKCANLYH
jgi:hypothetical protein